MVKQRRYYIGDSAVMTGNNDGARTSPFISPANPLLTVSPINPLANMQNPVTTAIEMPVMTSSNQDVRQVAIEKAEAQAQREKAKEFDIKEFYTKYKKPIVISGLLVGIFLTYKIVT